MIASANLCVFLILIVTLTWRLPPKAGLIRALSVVRACSNNLYGILTMNALYKVRKCCEKLKKDGGECVEVMANVCSNLSLAEVMQAPARHHRLHATAEPKLGRFQMLPDILARDRIQYYCLSYLPTIP